MKKKNLYSYVLWSFIGLTLLITVFMEIENIRSYYTKWSSEKEINMQTLTFYTQYWESKFDMIDSSLLMLNSPEYNEVYDKMNGEERTLEFEMAKQEFQNKIQQAVSTNNDDFFIFYYNPDRNLYLRASNSEYSYAQSMQIKNIVNNWIEDGIEFENSGSWVVMDTENNMYFAHIYRGSQGYVGAAVNMDLIVKSIEESVDSSAVVAITDGIGNVLFNEAASGENGEEITAELEKAHCRISIIETKDVLLKRVIPFALHTCMLTVLVIFICVFIIKGNIRKVLQPLIELQKGLALFGGGDMDVRLKDKWEITEIQELYQTFNAMADKIKHLTVDVYGAQLERQKIEYNYLKIQIQPHFYSNVLNLIYGLAEIHDCKSIQKLSMAMAKYFRYLLSHKDSLVSVQSELECVENYMEIQKMRYSDCIVYQVEYEGDVQNILMPPIVIQTFVENAIQHNITQYSPIEVKVRIKVCEKTGRTEITVEDNGSGFDEEMLEGLRNGKDISVNGRGIGIQNIIQRLDLLYGPENSRIELSNKEHGAIVFVDIPLKRRMGKDESIAGR